MQKTDSLFFTTCPMTISITGLKNIRCAPKCQKWSQCGTGKKNIWLTKYLSAYLRPERKSRDTLCVLCHWRLDSRVEWFSAYSDFRNWCRSFIFFRSSIPKMFWIWGPKTIWHNMASVQFFPLYPSVNHIKLGRMRKSFDNEIIINKINSKWKSYW